MSLVFLKLYISKRFRFIPWLPLIIFLTVYSNPSSFNFISFLYIALWTFHFRLFDDFFCFDYDLALGKQKEFESLRSEFKLIKNISFIALAITTGFMFDKFTLLLMALLILISLFLYDRLKNSIYIQLVSVLKYPVLIHIIERRRFALPSSWACLFFMVFLTTEILQILNIKLNKMKYIQYIALLSLGILRVTRG